jgi:hypothetical protein
MYNKKEKNEMGHGPLKGSLFYACTVKELSYKRVTQALLLYTVDQDN